MEQQRKLVTEIPGPAVARAVGAARRARCPTGVGTTLPIFVERGAGRRSSKTSTATA